MTEYDRIKADRKDLMDIVRIIRDDAESTVRILNKALSSLQESDSNARNHEETCLSDPDASKTAPEPRKRIREGWDG